MSQLELPAVDLPPAVHERIKKVSDVARALRMASNDLQEELRRYKRGFPEAHYILLSHLSHTLDQLQVLYQPKHLTTSAEDKHSDGNSRPNEPPRVENPAQDRWAENQ